MPFKWCPPAALGLCFVHTIARLASREESIEPTDEELIAAVVAESTDSMDSMLLMGKDIDRFIYFQGQYLTPTMIACLIGKPQHLAKLIEKNVLLDRQNIEGLTALQLASLRGQHGIAEFLINAQADVNLQESHGYSPLYMASLSGHASIVELLIKAQADVDLAECMGESPLHAATERGCFRIVELLIKSQANVNIRNKKGQSALHIAANRGEKEIVQLLISAQADVNIRDGDGCSLLLIAVQAGDTELAKLLINAQADVNLQRNSSESPLHIAAMQGNYQIVDALVDAQANVNVQRNTGSSPLYFASQNGHQHVVESLIRAQANVNLQNNVGSTPLYIASQNGHYKIAEALIKAEANVNLRMNSGYSALYIAAQNGHTQVVHLLIEAKAEVNLQSGAEYSPLYIASQNGHDQVVKLLIGAKAKHQIEANGLFPILAAKGNGHFKVVELLRKAYCGNDNFDPLEQDSFEGCFNTKLEFLSSLPSAVSALSWQSVSQRQVQLNFNCKNWSDAELSEQLHSALSQSGFVETRAALQSAVADVLQDILRLRLSASEVHIVGSFSEGWGNSLVKFDGRTDINADIDVMQLIPGRPFHPRGICECGLEAKHTVEYANGHLLCPGYAANPATPYGGSALRPAVDAVSARRLCCYPPIAPLLPHRQSSSNISPSVLQLLEQSMASLPCHVVHAAPPGKAGEQLRVSTSFLEKQLLRSLSTLQGQLFVILKWLLKKLAGSNNVGFKSYHAKTIVFKMLEETPIGEWEPQHLVDLTRRSLKMLLNGVESWCGYGGATGEILSHFFLSDAAIYLKGLDPKSAGRVTRALNQAAGVLKKALDELHQLLLRFKDSLRPIADSGLFHFHPFLILPDLKACSISPTETCEYHAIYDIVRESVLRLSNEDCSQESSALEIAKLLGKLPDCARSAREALRVLACLKFGDRRRAAKLVSECRELRVSKGIYWPTSGRQASEATKDFVWQHLKSNDTAWKFCLRFDRRPHLPLARREFSELFPMQLENYASYFYLNFDALLQALHVDLTGTCDALADDWMRDVLHRNDQDEQELVVAQSFKAICCLECINE